MTPRATNTLFFVILLAVAVGVGAWWYTVTQSTAPTSSTEVVIANRNAAVSDVPAAPTVTTTTDLTSAQTTLDQIDVNADATDSNQLDLFLAEF